ncbi:MAG: DUF4886 domain-containing protein, partial [Armatimonadetes bacterium]|nr:DUF4886 domain-containing protein [Candidatus Hippobium faecium]
YFITLILLLLMVAAMTNAKEIKVLSIGNSFSHDAFCYVPFLMKDIAPDVDLTLEIAAIGGCSLQQHITYAKSNEPNYQFYKHIPNKEEWEVYNEKTLKDALLNEKWDIIILQQVSEQSQRYDTYQPYLNDLIAYIFETIDYNAKLAWHLTPSYGHTGYEGIEMYERISLASQKVLADTPIEMVFPNGTAIQNARGTYLKDLGDMKHLSGDNLHMQDGLPRQIEAYTSILTILNTMGMGYKSIFGNKTICDEKWVEGKTTWTPKPPVGSTPENLLIAQKCAIAAFKHPFEITEIK